MLLRETTSLQHQLPTSKQLRIECIDRAFVRVPLWLLRLHDYGNAGVEKPGGDVDVAVGRPSVRPSVLSVSRVARPAGRHRALHCLPTVNSVGCLSSVEPGRRDDRLPVSEGKIAATARRLDRADFALSVDRMRYECEYVHTHTTIQVKVFRCRNFLWNHRNAIHSGEWSFVARRTLMMFIITTVP